MPESSTKTQLSLASTTADVRSIPLLVGTYAIAAQTGSFISLIGTSTNRYYLPLMVVMIDRRDSSVRLYDTGGFVIHCAAHYGNAAFQAILTDLVR